MSFYRFSFCRGYLYVRRIYLKIRLCGKMLLEIKNARRHIQPACEERSPKYLCIPLSHPDEVFLKFHFLINGQSGRVKMGA